MRSLLALSLALCLPLLLLADDRKKDDKKKPEPKPNTLTEKEVRDGWLLLFDGESTFGWKIEGEAKVDRGVLILGGEKATKAEVSTAFINCDVALEATWERKTTPKAPWTQSGSMKGSASGGLQLGENPLASGGNSYLKIFTPVKVDVPANTRVLLRSVKLKFNRTNPAALAVSLFNGKDTSGWKEFKGKGKKSKFSVTKEGWLNVKDGPGDLQTEKLFGDFVLQLECISNGKHLNSGIFFRCIPGEYQNGYEAQIQNDFTVKPPRKYTVEEYDPQTHKLAGKKTVESAAKDYGTGAIYRRMPARKGVAKDGEWFAMTVVARGRHIATWVNGIQQVDWTDNRPEDKNPRKGYRAEAGAISIQGHDPTTDLSFRNIRIVELPRPKK
jgi:hypothetical protein